VSSKSCTDFKKLIRTLLHYWTIHALRGRFLSLSSSIVKGSY